MLEEFGGAPGAGGKKETLIDVEAEKAREEAKPLPGQIALEKATRIKIPKKIGIVKRSDIKKAVKRAPPERGARVSLAELLRIHAGRSQLSRATDERLSHQITISPDSPRVRAWIRGPGRADIVGIDTPGHRKGAKPKSKAPTTGLKSFKRGKIYHTPTRGGTLLSRRPLGRSRRR
jgi:hypothetical protein